MRKPREPREQPHPGAAGERRVVAGGAQVARPDHHVVLTARRRRNDRGEIGGIVLSVRVELDRDVVAVRDRVAEAGLQRSAHAEIHRMA